MAKFNPTTILFLFISISISSTTFSNFCSAKEGNNTNIKISFYGNDTYVGPNPSSVLIAGVGSTLFEFGSTFAFDIPLFLEFEPNTTTNAIGKAKGIYTIYTRDDLSASITMN
ncbi:hypothetical protein ZOSMA_30G00380 [Zostera marina]|uniref:Dirigent protein n=1 Tax=Zostera marina TaxID=29655 RepID=A0A0K9PBY8_ZOSMR|nr:hypothetical protein ZOSMA_30G00380 [Zostera marina]